jgi:hypothetical protein
MSANEPKISRRTLVSSGVVLGLAVLGPSFSLSGCGGQEGPNCMSPPGLTPDATAKRATFHYAEPGPDPARKCANCTFLTAGPAATQCSPCSLGLGDVNPNGTCDSFAARS